MAQLQNWVSQARSHWKEFQPTLYSQLVKSGKLEQALQQAAKQTALEMNQLEEQGMTEHEAWEMTREQYLFPPEEQSQQPEEDEPTSGAALSEIMGMPLGEDEPEEQADQQPA